MRVPKIAPRQAESGSILLRFQLTQEGAKRNYKLTLPLKWAVARDRRMAEQIAELIKDDIKHDLLGLQPPAFDPTLQKYRPGLPAVPKQPKNLLDIWDKFVEFKVKEGKVQETTLTKVYPNTEKVLSKVYRHDPGLLAPEKATDFFNYLTDNYKPSTLVLYYKNWSACANWAVEREIWTKNPYRRGLRELEGQCSSENSGKAYSDKEAQIILNAIATDRFTSKFATIKHSYYYEFLMLLEIASRLQRGERVLLNVSSQKADSLYSGQNLEKYLQPYCKGKILMLDSNTVADKEHEAYEITNKLNDLKDYQLVIATPVIETGVSIEADLFDAVSCISWGVQPVHSVCQALARYRRPVPRHVWIQKRPANMMKEGGVVSTDQLNYLMESNQKRLRLLNKELGRGCFTNSIYETWVESVIRFNLGHQAYRENLKALLVADGHRVTEIDPMNITDDSLKQIRDAAYQAEIQDINNADTPSDLELETLNNSAALTKAQRYQQRKGNLIKTYGQCSEAIIKADDNGCFKPLQLLYYLTVGRTYLEAHDQRVTDRSTAKNQRLDHEIGRSALSVKVAVLNNLSITELLSGELFSNDHPIVQIIDNVDRGDFLSTFGRKLPCRGNLPSRLGDRINTFLELVGYKKEEVCRKGTGKNEKRYYRAVPKFEGIDYQQIFEHWLERDRTLSPQLSESLNEDAIEADMWSLFFNAIAHDCLPEVWQSIKAMGQKWAEKVYDQFSDVIQQLDPEWVARWAF